jgi:hypothetical protein
MHSFDYHLSQGDDIDMEAEYIVGTLQSGGMDVQGTKGRRQTSQHPLVLEGGKHRNQANARERDRTHR